MRKTLRKSIVAVIIFVTTMLLHGNVFATGGQANGIDNTLYNKTVSYFFELVRSMEMSSGTLAKTSNIDTSNYVDSSGNGIDCHLEKNTEYGTITILASSDYGNKPTYKNDATHTANTADFNSGVFQMSNGFREYVANTLQESPTSAKIANNYNRALTNADPRYVDEYTSTTKYSIPGDGIIETDGWGGNTNFVTTGYPVFYRSFNGFFGYGSNFGNAYTYYGARAVVVCGPGL